MQRLVTILLVIFSPLVALAQSAIWQDVSPNSITVRTKRVIVPDSYRTVRLDQNALLSLLGKAPMEFTAAAKKNSVILPIPMPDGKMARFRIQQSPISAPDPSGKRSAFQSFSGQGIDDRTATLRCDISSAGFHAQIISSSKTIYVDPFAIGDTVNCIVYNKGDLRREGRAFCLPPSSELLLPASVKALTSSENQLLPLAANGSMLRSARTAIAVTGEYTTFFRQGGDTDPQAKDRALLAIKTTMNRVNGIWERDAAVRYVLISDAQELNIIYTNGATDPYTNNNAGMLATENQANLDTVIMDANYDIGHVFATAQGGIGGGGVCLMGQKAMGATGQPMPVGDPFDIDYVAHEIIHQWQGGHTFNDNASGACPGNREAMVAVEPGSGATTASYSGICDPNNLQQNSDDAFHSVSIAQILSFLANTATCLATTATGNTPPTVSVPASFTIPQNTPFTLTATASDVDGDALTYSWEEIDLGTASPPNTDDGSRPIFRPYRPVTSPARTFPSLTYILNNANNPPATFTGTSATGAVCRTGETCISGESMPTTTRTMQFRVTVRDNRAGGGGINDATTAVNVRADSGPFVVTAPNTAVTVTGGMPFTVTWNVANTTAAPVSAANVKISLSTDGGMTFPTVLLASTPNDGTESVTIPNTGTTTARIKVEAVGNIFFDISDTNFTITGGGPTPTPTNLVNIATRMSVQTGDNRLIAGFIVTGTAPKRVIVRALGPSLSVAGVPIPGRLGDTTLQLVGPGGPIATNDNWRTTQQAEIIASTVPPPNDLESAIVATLPANSSAYTAIVEGAGNTSGIGSVEVYDLDQAAASQLANISTRGLVQAGDNVMIGGIIVVGPGTRRVIVRALGPSLNVGGVPIPGRLSDSTLEIANANGMILFMNDDWRSTQEAEIIATTVPPPNNLESAIVATLPAAPYTAIVRGKNGATGIGQVEVYALTN